MSGYARLISKCTKGLTSDDEALRAHNAVGFIRPVPNLKEFRNPVIINALVGCEVNPQTSILRGNAPHARQPINRIGKVHGKPFCKGLRRVLLTGPTCLLPQPV